MKVGDIVKITIPGPDHIRRGIIVESILAPYTSTRGASRNVEQWWLVLRNDTGTVEKFHEKWCEVIKD